MKEKIESATVVGLLVISPILVLILGPAAVATVATFLISGQSAEIDKGEHGI